MSSLLGEERGGPDIPKSPTHLGGHSCWVRKGLFGVELSVKISTDLLTG